MTSTLAKAGAALLLALGLTSCASISVEEDTAHPTAQKPAMIIVTLFDASRGGFKVDREGEALIDFKDNLRMMLAVAMKTDLTNRLVFAEIAGKGVPPKNAWLVRGTFTKVNQGSRLLRSGLGFGAGGTKLETKVEVYDQANKPTTPFLTFLTTGGSGAEPGAVLTYTTDPLEIAVGGISGVAHGRSEDASRTAREITAELSDYMYRRHWISEDKWIKPKALSGNPFP
jgi:hypothetical protein